MDTFSSFYLPMTILHYLFLFKYFLIVLHLLNKRYLVDLDKDKCFVSLFTLPYLPALDTRVRFNCLPLVSNYFMRSNRRGEWFKVLDVLDEEDEFAVDELISSFVCLRSRFRTTSFNVNNCWLRLPQLTNSSTIRWSFDLFLTPASFDLTYFYFSYLMRE